MNGDPAPSLSGVSSASSTTAPSPPAALSARDVAPLLLAPSPNQILLLSRNNDLIQRVKSVLDTNFDVRLVDDADSLLRIAGDGRNGSTARLILVDYDIIASQYQFHLVTLLRRNPSSALIPVILLFNSIISELVHEKAFQYGADTYLVQSFSSQQLLSRVSEALCLSRFRQRMYAERKDTLLQTFMLLCPVGIMRLDVDRRVVYANRKARHLLDMPDSFLSGFVDWAKCIHPEDASRVLSTWMAHAKERDTAWKCEFRAIRRDGSSSAYVMCEDVAEKNDEGRVVGYIESLTDITQTTIAFEETRRQDRLSAEQAIRLQTEEHRMKIVQFVDTMCHELRNPVQGTYGALQLMQSLLAPMEKSLADAKARQADKQLLQMLEGFTSDLKDCVAIFKQCIHFQKRLLDDVLRVSKLEEGKVHLSTAAFDLCQVLPTVELMFRSELKGKNIHFDLTQLKPFGAASRVPLVTGDADRLVEVLVNLVSNAIKFSKEDGTIAVHPKLIDQTERQLVIEVRVVDSGLGMNADQLSKLFGRFHKTTTEYNGSGLGLLISKKIVELMGGNMTIQSAPNEGTSITFSAVFETVPRSGTKEDSSAVVEKKTPVPAVLQSLLCVLVVEDNRINQKMLVRLLEKEGVRCLVASTGEEAVAIMTQGDASTMVDAILMDIEMPVMNGFDATRLIRLSNATVPILAVSGYSTEEYKQKAAQVGMTDYLTKPYEICVLMAKLRQHVQKFRSSA